MKVLIPALLAVALLAGCAVYRPAPACPMDDAYAYFSCAKPSFARHGSEEDETYRHMVSVVEAYCEDDASEWIPALEKSARASLPAAKEFLKSGPELKDWLPNYFTLEEQPLESLDDDELYRAVLAMYLFSPLVTIGRNIDITANCVEEFEFINGERLVKFMKE